MTTELFLIDRRDLYAAFGGNETAVKVFEDFQQRVADALVQVSTTEGQTSDIRSAAVYTAGETDALPGAVTLTAGRAVMIDEGVISALSPLVTGGHDVTLSTDGETNLALPLKGVVATREWVEQFAKVDGAFSGWAVYVHGGGTQSLVAAARAKIAIDGATKIESQLPPDTGPLWDTATDTITGRNGDAIVVKVQCVFTPTSALASEIVFDVDIGGTVGVVEEQKFTVAGGAGVPVPISWTFVAYTLDTWEANGGAVYAEADGPGDITGLRILIDRTHKARS